MPSTGVTNEKPPKRMVPADKIILDLLKEAISGEMEDAEYYAKLISMTRSPYEKSILRQIRLDEHKHEKILRDIYKKICAEEPDVKPEHKPVGRKLQAEYEKSVINELDGADFRKRIYLMFINLELRDMLLDIFTDEQSHAVKLMSLCVSSG